MVRNAVAVEAGFVRADWSVSSYPGCALYVRETDAYYPWVAGWPKAARGAQRV